MPHIEQVSIEGGASLWTCTSGAGTPLLLCHGGPGLWDDLDDVAHAIDDLVTVHRYDQRGCGRSSGAGPFSIAQSVADMEALREHFGYDAWIIGGHSWGASLALHYAMAHPDRTRALLLIAGTGIGHGWREAYHADRLRRLGAHRERWEALSSRPRSPEEDREYVLLTWATDFAERDRAIEHAGRLLPCDSPLRPNYACNAAINAETRALDETELSARAAAVRAPVLIVHGSEDPRPVSATDSLLDALSNARRVIIEGAGHYPWVEKPDEFRAAVRGFVAEPGREGG